MRRSQRRRRQSFCEPKAGAIINIASVLAFAPEFLDGVYSGSKAYLLNLSLSMARKMTSGNVQIQVVLPGATRTEIWERSGKDVDAIVQRQSWIRAIWSMLPLLDLTSVRWRLSHL
ncbi:SDR family NAD(P)-dependent oxidoreductase [Pararhizobium sp. DWP1-1-3]|uniref:SDR family NAD(P)-dependent oxidoreductase n=1 Tax=Pararhizobium sp. DWP1-1-3 TaxID=2804652 RepID=UPI003CFA458A